MKNFFKPKICFAQKNFSGQKYLSTKNFFWTKRYFDKRFFQTKKRFSPEKFSDPKFLKPNISFQPIFLATIIWKIFSIDPTPKFKSNSSLTLKIQILYDLGFSGSERAPPAPLGWYFHLKINFWLFPQLISGTTITLIVLLNKNHPYRRMTDEGLVANINDILMGGILCFRIFWIHPYKEYSHVNFCCCWKITITKQQKLPSAFFRDLRMN